MIRFIVVLLILLPAIASANLRDQNIYYCEANFPRASDLGWSFFHYLKMVKKHDKECEQKYDKPKWAGKCDSSTHRCAP